MHLPAFLHTPIWYLAQIGGSAQAAQNFWQSDAGTAIAAVLSAVAVLLLLGTLFGTLKFFSQGDPGSAFKVLLGGFLVAAILFAPAVLVTLLEGGAELMSRLASSLGELVRSGDGG